MKYSKGDKVRIRNIDWYEQMLSIPSKLVWQNNLTEDFIGIWCGSHVFRKEMCEFCGMVMTIQEVGIDFYLMEEDKMGYKFTDEMIAGEDVSWMYDGKLVAERFSDDKEVPKFKVGDRIYPKYHKPSNDLEIIEVIRSDGHYGYRIKNHQTNGTYCMWGYEIFDYKLAEDESKPEPKFKVGDMICRAGGLSNGCLVMSVSDEYYGLQMGEGNVGVLPVKDQDEWVLLSAGDKKIEGLVEEANKLDADAFSDGYDQGYEDGQHDMNEWKLPDGFEFRDGDGNLIAVDKIVLVKKRARYPQSYEECCEIVKVGKEHTLEGEIIRINNYKIAILESFQKLLICRDAYWKIYGEEMGLEGKWEPDWSDCRKFAIVVEGNEILADVCLRRNRILVFPTEEMRDEFLKVFRNYIEECKEFL